MLQISTEIAKSFTSKDLAETFPRQIACLEHLQETSYHQPHDVAAADSVHISYKDLNVLQDSDSSRDRAALSADLTDSAELTQMSSALPVDAVGSDTALQYDATLPHAGLVFGDLLPWSFPSDGFAVVDTEDLVHYMDSHILFNFELGSFADSTIPIGQDLELQLPTDDIFPTAEPFFV